MLLIVICAESLPAHLISRCAADDLLGVAQRYQVKNNESLVEIAREFDLGFNAIVAANPGVDPFVPKNGTMLDVPSEWILPAVATRPVILINVPEFRLYYFPKEANGRVLTFPLGIGDEGSVTPVGSYTVIEKIENPAWVVPKSIRQAASLPKVVPPGPDNPMGSHALRLSLPSILIHGTNRPWGIGRRSSHGCLRLYPEDIARLFKLVPTGTRVDIVDKPIKVGARSGRVFVESHRFEAEGPAVGEALQLLADKELLGRTDFSKLVRVVEESRGMPVDVTLDNETSHPPQDFRLFQVPWL